MVEKDGKRERDTEKRRGSKRKNEGDERGEKVKGEKSRVWFWTLELAPLPSVPTQGPATEYASLG